MKSLQYIALSNLPDYDLWALFLDISKARGINFRVLEKERKIYTDVIHVIRDDTWCHNRDTLERNMRRQFIIEKDSIYNLFLKTDLRYISTDILEKTSRILEHILCRTSDVYFYFDGTCVFSKNKKIAGKEILLTNRHPDNNGIYNLSKFFYSSNLKNISIGLNLNRLISLLDILFTQDGYEMFCEEWCFK